MTRLVLPFVFILAAAAAHRPCRGQVAVFVDPTWATRSRNDVLPAPLIARLIGPFAAVTQLSAAELADADTLDVAKFPVLVLPDTDALPDESMPAMLEFHRKGGCLVMFRAPSEKLGLFRSAGTVRHDRPCTRAVVAGNPLGITPPMLAGSLPNQQRLDPKSLPAEDMLLPLVVVEQEGGGPALPIAAAIRRGCPQAAGARDVWLGQTVWNLDAEERWFAEQLLVRGVLWCLAEKGLKTADEVAAAWATLDAVPRPPPLPDALPIARSARPWGESIVPRSPPPSRRLSVVDLSKLPLDERAAVCCLQGLTSRRQPSIWLLRSAGPQDQDRFWLDEHVRQGAIDGYDLAADWKTLVARHAPDIRGAVVPDPECDRGDVIAMNVAACEDLLLCSPALAARLSLPVTVDLRGRFRGYLEGMEWVLRNYRDRLSRHAINYFHPARLAWGNVDQCYQWRIPMVWTSHKIDAFAPHADPSREHDLVARMLAAMDTHSIVTGWPSFGPDRGVDEYLAVMQATPYSHGYVPSDGLANASVTSGFPMPELRQPVQPAAPKAEPGRLYLSLVISDGDNLSPWMDYFRRHSFAEGGPAIPLGITIGPAIRETLPVAARWYFDHARPGTEFVCGVSGATYVSPEVFADRLADPDAAWRIFLDDTSRGMRSMGLESVNLSPRGEPMADRYARALPFCHGVIRSWHRHGDDPSQLLEWLPCGTPAFRSATASKLSFSPSADVDGGVAMARAFHADLERLVQPRLAAGEPVFATCVLSCWDWKRGPLEQLVATKPSHVVLVTPTQLSTLARRWRRPDAQPTEHREPR